MTAKRLTIDAFEKCRTKRSDLIMSDYHVPKDCLLSDGDRITKDCNGYMINLARCLITRDLGLTNYCDEIRAFDKCPKGYK